MKILLVGWGYPPNIDGGLDVAVKELFEGLQNREHSVDLLLPSERAPDRENIIPVDVSGDMHSKSEDLSRKAASVAENYDIIHTHDWFGVESGFKSKKYSDTNWIASFHSINSSRSRSPSKQIEKLERAGVKQADIVTAVSDKLSNEIESEYGRRPQTVYNGFSEASATTDKELDFEEPVFFFVGRHAEQKGIEHLIYGFKKFLENNMKGTLVIGGNGHMQESFQDFVEILHIEDRVIFEGFIPENELGSYYRTADVFVSPSINEPFGLTISEALNAGTRVVCTESGVNELLKDEKITVVEPNSDSICEGLEKSLEKESPDVDGRDWSENVSDYIELYEKLV